MIASLSRNGKILRASALARIGFNHQTVTGHTTLASSKDATASKRFTLNFRIADAILYPFLREVLRPTWFAMRLPVPDHS